MNRVEQYCLKYNFGEWNERIKKYLNKVFEKSKLYLARQYSNGELIDVKNEYTSMIEYISYTEEYLYYNRNSPGFYYILKAVENIDVISVLPKNSRGIYGYTSPDNHIILVNPNLSSSRTLTSKERTRLYVAHELGHYINKEWMNSVISFLDEKIHSGEIEQNKAILFKEGFSLLDEAITQNRAEDFAYVIARKARPNMRNYTNRSLFNGEVYQSNFDFYGELQTPAIMFGRTLRGIGKIENAEEVLKELCNRATNPNFAKKIIEEYTSDGQLSNLFPLMENMGIIKLASYYMFGANTASGAVKASKVALDTVKNYANILRDQREPQTFKYKDK